MSRAIFGAVRKTMRQWFKVQLIVLGLVTFISLVFGIQFATSVFIGGMICFLPNFIFARSWFSFFRAAYPQQLLMMFYFGEGIKFFLMTSLFLLAFKFLSVNVLACLSGFISAQAGLWLGSMIKKD